MFAGSRRIAVALTFAMAAAAEAQSFAYAPGTATYRISQDTKASQEAMGQKNEMEGTSTQVLTIALARSARDTLTMNVTVDSISSSMGMPQMLDQFIGMMVTAKVSPVGEVYSTKAGNDKGGADAVPLHQELGGFLPRLRATLTRGATWTDTAVNKLTQNGLEIERKTVSTYRVEGDTTIAGQSSWKIAKSDSIAMSGSGNTANGPMTMEGTSRGNGTLFVTPQGLYLGGEGTRDDQLRFVVAANGMEVGMTQSTRLKIEKVK
jgi:hypothetical protein